MTHHSFITSVSRLCTVLTAACLLLAAAFTSAPIPIVLAASPHWVCMAAPCGFGSDSFTSIQAAIDASAPGDVINVLPGTYSETAVDRKVLGGTPYTFGLFIATDGLTIQGVDSSGAPITQYTAIAANVETNATNDFGPSGVWVEGDNVTIRGLKIWQNPALGENKNLEIIGDNFTLSGSHVTSASVTGSSVYFDDLRFTNNISHVKSYRVEGNWLDNVSVDLTSGAGYSGPTSGRLILNNKIENVSGGYAAVSFSSSGTAVPWFLDPVSGAVVQGNTFANSSPYIRARGNYDNSQFDWASFWNDNTFDRGVMTGPNPPSVPTAFTYQNSYGDVPNTREISASIQSEVDHASSGDTVLVKSGTYPEQVIVNAKSLSIQGAGVDQTIIQSPTYAERIRVPRQFNGTNRIIDAVVGVFDSKAISLSGLTIDGQTQGAPTCIAGERFAGVALIDSTGILQDAKLINVRQAESSFGCQDSAGMGVLAASASTSVGSAPTITIQRVTVSNFQKNGITAWAVATGGLNVSVLNNHIIGPGPIKTTAQNGIQVSFGAGGMISGNTVEGISYTGGMSAASSILVYQASTVVVQNNTVNNGQVGIYFAEAGGSIDSNTINATTAGTGSSDYYGVIVSDPTGKRPSPSESISPAAGNKALAAAAETTNNTVTVTNNSLLGGSDTLTANGLELDGGYEGGAVNVDVTATNNFIRGWGNGVSINQCSDSTGCYPAKVTSANLNQNSIEGNTAGLNNSTSLVINAAHNWWGSSTGPTLSSNSGGQGQSISGAANFNPWLCSGTDAQPLTPGFQPISGSQCTSAPTRLVFGAQPQGGYTGQPFIIQPVVRAEDDQGNLGINFNDPVLLSTGTNPAGGVLVGTTILPANQGIATFVGLSIDKAGSSYSLVAFTSSGLRLATSNTFAILPPSADLSLTMVGNPNPASPGDKLTYTLKAANLGPSTAASITVTQTLPTGTSLVSAGGDGWTCAQLVGGLSCTRPNLAVGSAPDLVIQVTAPATAGTLHSSSAVSAQTADPNTDNNTANSNILVVVIPVTGRNHLYLPSLMTNP